MQLKGKSAASQGNPGTVTAINGAYVRRLCRAALSFLFEHNTWKRARPSDRRKFRKKENENADTRSTDDCIHARRRYI